MADNKIITCEDCIHYNICLFHYTDDENKRCKNFKNKADFVEVVLCEKCEWYNLKHLACMHPNFNGYINMGGYCSYGINRCEKMKYRKKPVVVEAYRTNKERVIHTPEGDMKANVGDYIITGVNGEQYPCKADIFEKTYEKVKGDNNNE